MNEPVSPPSPPAQNSADREHLRLLTIFHYVVGGLECLGTCFGGIYATVGIILLCVGDAKDPEGALIGGIICTVFGLVMMLAPLILGVLTLVSAKKIKARASRTFSLVVAGVNCVVFPFGTALGVFTIMVLTRESVRRLYEGGGEPA